MSALAAMRAAIDADAESRRVAFVVEAQQAEARQRQLVAEAESQLWKKCADVVVDHAGRC